MIRQAAAAGRQPEGATKRHAQQQHAGSAPSRDFGRKEWSRDADRAHQVEGREHARRAGKTHKAHDIREQEAERLIRELRARY